MGESIKAKFKLIISFLSVLLFQNCGQFEVGDQVVTGSSFVNKIGEELYNSKCASCHMANPDARALGADFDKIKAAALIVTAMQQIQIDDNEIALIAAYLQELGGTSHAGPVGSSGQGGFGGGGEPYIPPSPQPLQKADAFGESGIQRLTKKQMTLSVERNLGVNLGGLADRIPFDSDSSTHFPNDYNLLSVTYPMINSYSDFAQNAAKLYELTRFQVDIGCSPSTAKDQACFETFVAKMGRRFFRRSLTISEIRSFSDNLLDYAHEDSRFMTAVEMALEVFLQHPEFLYRIEKGTNGPAPNGLVRLSAYEVASRLSFLIEGRGPSDQLMDIAEAGGLDSAAQRADYTEQLLEGSEAKSNWADFHGYWLGYGEIVSSHSLKDDFQMETHKLLENINFIEKSDWLDIFTAKKTFLTPALANHYGISGVDQARWVATTGQRQSGLLSHASFAAVGAKFSDTSPTLRGYEVFKRMFCGEFTESIPDSVDVTQAPGNPNDCKSDRYIMRTIQSCAGCHAVTDGLGFGLETIDQFGRFRIVESTSNQCTIDGKGVYGNQDFVGPLGLASIVAGNPEVGACATKNVFEYMMGRSSNLDDKTTLKALEGAYYKTRTLHGILKAIVSSEAMIHMKER